MIFFPNSHKHVRGDRRGGAMNRGDACGDARDRNRGTSFFALLFIRAVDRPISHADICLSKITFLLMSANVPRLLQLIGAT